MPEKERTSKKYLGKISPVCHVGSGDEADGGTKGMASLAKAQESVGEAAALGLLEFGSLPVKRVGANGNIVPCVLVLHLY